MVDAQGWEATAKIVAGGVAGWIVSLSISPARSLADMALKGASAVSLAGLCSFPTVDYFGINQSYVGFVAGMWALFGLSLAKNINARIKKIDFLAVIQALVKK